MKGLFIPEITAEMFKNGCLESIDALMAEGEIYDIDYPLKQEPCEDCISRETARRIVDSGRTRQQMIDMILATLPVTPQQKIGHWINIYATHSKCDRCWAVFEITSSNGEVNYCPNCGAKMESEE